MRTTVRIDDAILREVTRLAAESGRALGAVIEDLLREALTRRRTSRPLSVCRGDALQPGVDLDDTSGLFDRMDAP